MESDEEDGKETPNGIKLYTIFGEFASSQVRRYTKWNCSLPLSISARILRWKTQKESNYTPFFFFIL